MTQTPFPNRFIFIVSCIIALFISLSSCKSTETDEEELDLPETTAYFAKDSVLAIKKKVEESTRTYRPVHFDNNFTVNIPVSYIISRDQQRFPVDLLPEKDPTSSTEDLQTPVPSEDDDKEEVVPKEQYFSMKSVFLEDRSTIETVMIADTTLADSVILNTYKNGDARNRRGGDNIIYEDTTTYMVVSGYGELFVYHFTPLSKGGKRAFYYGVVEKASNNEAKTTELAFQLLENGKALLSNADSATPSASNFYNGLNLLEQPFINRLTNSLIKEGQAFLDTGTIARYPITEYSKILMAHELDAIQTVECLKQTPAQKQVTPLSCSLEQELPERKQFLDMDERTGLVILQKSDSLVATSIYRNSAFSDDPPEWTINNSVYICPVTINKKNFYLGLEANGEPGPYQKPLLEYIKTTITR